MYTHLVPCTDTLGIDDDMPEQLRSTGDAMKTFDVVVEKDSDTGLLVGYVPGWPGAHTQGADIDELQENLQEVLAMLLEDGDPELESEFVGVRKIQVA